MANPTWGSPRIVGELGKLGINVAESTVEKYMACPHKPPSPTWRSFLKNHVSDLVAIDFFVVPTARFKVLFVLAVLLHHRRRLVHFNVTEHPSAQWAAQQLVGAFPWIVLNERHLRRTLKSYFGYYHRWRTHLSLDID